MKNVFIIRFLALALCVAMAGEITVAVQNGDAISAEADGEMEHEESNEDEKEKTPGGFESLLLAERSIISKQTLTAYKDSMWKSPLLDFQTPPPELA